MAIPHTCSYSDMHGSPALASVPELSTTNLWTRLAFHHVSKLSIICLERCQIIWSQLAMTAHQITPTLPFPSRAHWLDQGDHRMSSSCIEQTCNT